MQCLWRALYSGVSVERLDRCLFFFFFQAEDGIRAGHVTGVQTCALPIYGASMCITVASGAMRADIIDYELDRSGKYLPAAVSATRSEERRVGKECRSRGSTEREKEREGRRPVVREDER